jgi:hypothetical protein
MSESDEMMSGGRHEHVHKRCGQQTCRYLTYTLGRHRGQSCRLHASGWGCKAEGWWGQAGTDNSQPARTRTGSSRRMDVWMFG